HLFFFFQAEDGIRDPLVTGVQTCALPISRVATHDFLRGVLQRVQVMMREPVAGKRIRRADSQVVALDGQESARADPTVEDGRGRSEERRVGKEGRWRWSR